ncbi:TlpA family protein disulfide reductase [Lacinutrix mariniflava]|uniref:TlpA family protein disulfide reductase n=1 Tax=Lacinutrix mariniflava TaxID=342955 RepID=UPI0006E2665A|nr:TlpA disulfide reductase family protein [Lacinutrix mariniflava]
MKHRITCLLKNTLPLLFLYIVISCNNKKEVNEFEVIIKTDAKTDSLSMYPSFVSKKFLDTTYPFLFKSAIKNGLVNFKGKKLSHPIMFDLLVDGDGLSEKFFIDNGTTELTVSFLDKDKKVIINSKTKSKAQKEYESLKKNGLDSIESLYKKSVGLVKERRRFSAIRDTMIVDFLNDNPDSYVPLWLMTNYFSRFGLKYNKLYDQSLNSFSEEIKNTELFKKLSTSIDETRKKYFLNNKIALKDFDLEFVNFDLGNINENKYILLDFWYTNCKPCLEEMPKYIPLYNKYKDKGFEIISISVDKTNKIQRWKTLIKEKGFNWLHYLDENGTETMKLNIISFPTTFLISSDGKIIERDIKAEKLETFLNSKLK